MAVEPQRLRPPDRLITCQCVHRSNTFDHANGDRKIEKLVKPSTGAGRVSISAGVTIQMDTVQAGDSIPVQTYTKVRLASSKFDTHIGAQARWFVVLTFLKSGRMRTVAVGFVGIQTNDRRRQTIDVFGAEER